MPSFSSTPAYPSTGTPKLKLKITKEDKKITVQVLEQDERFRYAGVRRGFTASNGFEVRSVDYPELFANEIFLRGQDTESDTEKASRNFSDNGSRDIYLARMEEALRDWAENAPEFKDAPDTSGRIVTFKSDKAEIEFVKFEKALAMQVKSMDERFRGGASGNARVYTSRNGMEVWSVLSPGFCRKGWEGKSPEGWLDLHGERRDNDLILQTIHFGSNADRDAYLSKALGALDDWSENWEGWKTADPAPSVCRCQCPCAQATSDEYIFTV